MKRFLLLLALLAIPLAGQSVQASAGGGNSGAAKACQKGGYLSLHRADGTPFANVGDCVSYAAQGGEFAAPPAVADVGCPAGPIPDGTPYQCTPVVTGSGTQTFLWTYAMPSGGATAPMQSASPAPYFTSLNGPTVTLTLTVCNVLGCVSANDVVALDTPQPQCFPTAPTGLAAVASGTGEVTLSWQSPGGCVQGYYVYFREDSDLGAIIGAEPSTPYNPTTESGVFNAGPNQAFTVRNLVPGKTYYFWVYSYGTGDAQGGVASVSQSAGS
ncbi:MAG: fibronectin type III domain-containing protein [Dehalococcoidia bacterium]